GGSFLHHQRPCDLAAILPARVIRRPIGERQDARALTLAVAERAVEGGAVGRRVPPVAVRPIGDEVALVVVAVRQAKVAPALHQSVLPLALIRKARPQRDTPHSVGAAILHLADVVAGGSGAVPRRAASLPPGQPAGAVHGALRIGASARRRLPLEIEIELGVRIEDADRPARGRLRALVPHDADLLAPT